MDNNISGHLEGQAGDFRSGGRGVRERDKLPPDHPKRKLAESLNDYLNLVKDTPYDATLAMLKERLRLPPGTPDGVALGTLVDYMLDNGLWRPPVISGGD